MGRQEVGKRLASGVTISTACRQGTGSPPDVFLSQCEREGVMLKGGLLWLLGIPLPIIIALWLFGYLH